MNSKITKSLYEILDTLKIAVYILGVVLFLCLIYQTGKFHGMMGTASVSLQYEEVCDVVGDYNDITNKCSINCNNGSNYFLNFNSMKLCIEDRPKFKDRLEIFLITGTYIKDEEILTYIEKIGVTK